MQGSSHLSANDTFRQLEARSQSRFDPRRHGHGEVMRRVTLRIDGSEIIELVMMMTASSDAVRLTIPQALALPRASV